VCLLRKALYGLKQAPQDWYSRSDAYFLQMGFEKSDVDLNLYFIIRGEDTLILIFYVDDLFITGAEDLIVECNLGLASEFEMSDIRLRMARGGSHISREGEVCNRYFEQVSYGELQTHVYTYDHQLEEA
jgi:hypothetical protein